MRVIVVEPTKEPVVKEIDHGLRSMQNVVGGLIQAIYPFDDPVAVVVNEEGKLEGLPWNRVLVNGEQPVDVLVGTLFICGLADGDFDSLSDDLAVKYMKKFSMDGLCVLTNKGFIPCVNMNEEEM